MIYIITGAINSGKTKKLLEIYNDLKAGDGFILPKIYANNQYIGQEILQLSTKQRTTFSLKLPYIPPNWCEEYSYDVYSFSKDGLIFANNIINDIISSNINPVFIDEIGPLELQQKGFFELLSRLLPLNHNLYMSIREPLLDKVIKKFSITNYNLIRV